MDTPRGISVIATVFALSVAACAPAPPVAPRPTPGHGETASPAPSAPVGELTRVGAMTSHRAVHTATTLLDGRVLIAGGCTEDSCEGITASTELLDPATGSSTPGPSMLQARVGHAAVLLRDGRVLMIGGFQTGTQTASTEIFDPVANAFSSGPNLLEALADPVAVVLGDGSVLVAGGFSGHASVASAELLDPALIAFHATGAMATPRSSHAGAILRDGRVIVIGGNARGDTGTVLRSAETYDPSTGGWTATGEMSVPRHKHAVVDLDGGRVLVLGGSNDQDGFGQYRSAEVYDPATGGFTATGDMTAARYKLSGAVVRLGDGRVLVAAGSEFAELYDPANGTFAQVLGAADAGFSFAAAARLPDGSVLVSGGYDDRIHLTDQILRFVP